MERASIVINGQRFFPCTYADCDKKFTKSSNLAQHLRIHTGEKPFVCQVCQRPFRQTGNLTKHLKSHQNAHLRWNRSTNDKPFKCEFPGCEKSFTAKSSLHIHITSNHSGMCSPISSASSDNTSMISEDREVTTGEDDEVYDNDGKRSQRQHHLRCHHPSCKKVFSSEAELRSHLANDEQDFSLENVALKGGLDKLFKFFHQYGANHTDFKAAAEPLLSSIDSARNMLSNDDDPRPPHSVANLTPGVVVSATNTGQGSERGRAMHPPTGTRFPYAQASYPFMYIPFDAYTPRLWNHSSQHPVGPGNTGSATGYPNSYPNYPFPHPYTHPNQQLIAESPRSQTAISNNSVNKAQQPQPNSDAYLRRSPRLSPRLNEDTDKDTLNIEGNDSRPSSYVSTSLVPPFYAPPFQGINRHISQKRSVDCLYEHAYSTSWEKPEN